MQWPNKFGMYRHLPKLMAILKSTEHKVDGFGANPLPPQTHSSLTVEDKDPESEKISRKRARSSSIELSDEKPAKIFRKPIQIACMHALIYL